MTYLLDASVQESDIVASARVALGLKIDTLELQVLGTLLQSGLLLMQLDALLTLGSNVLLDLLGQRLGATHFANSSRSHILLVSKLRLEVEDLAVRQGSITLCRRTAPRQVFEACCSFGKPGL